VTSVPEPSSIAVFDPKESSGDAAINIVDMSHPEMMPNILVKTAALHVDNFLRFALTSGYNWPTVDYH